MSKCLYDGPAFFKKYPQEKHKYIAHQKEQAAKKRRKIQQEEVSYSHANSSFDRFIPVSHNNDIDLQHNTLADIVRNFHPHKMLFATNSVLAPLGQDDSSSNIVTSSFSPSTLGSNATGTVVTSDKNIQDLQNISNRVQPISNKQSNGYNIASIQSVANYRASVSASVSASASAESAEQYIFNKLKSREKELLNNRYQEMRHSFNTRISSNTANTVQSFKASNVSANVNSVASTAPVHVDLDDQKESIYRDTTNYTFPDSSSLVRPVNKNDSQLEKWILKKCKELNKALNAYHVDARVTDWTNGPTVTQFKVKVHLGTKVEKIRHLANDLKMALAAKTIRIQAPIPGETTCGVEIPNPKPRPVMLSEVLDSKAFKQAKSPLTIALGIDLEGKPRIADLRKMPHGLIAGATGSGKSVFINCMLISLLYKATPRQLRLILIDPKAVELAPYNGIPHLITPVISEPKQATAALHWCVKVMNKRYFALEKAHVRNIEQYNVKMDKIHHPEKKMPYIVIVIDELADLMMVASNAVETYIVRITQKARAAGLHLIVATQRPSVDIVTGTIKNNIPTRIAFMVSSQVDSRTIIDTGGAERLLGKGDMLYLGSGQAHPIRLQGCFVGNKEIDSIVKQVKTQAHAHYDFQPKALSKKVSALKHQDKLLPQVLAYLSHESTISTSKLQRVFSIGYNRSAKIIDSLQKKGIISSQDGSKPRKVFLSNKDYQQLKLKLK